MNTNYIKYLVELAFATIIMSTISCGKEEVIDAITGKWKIIEIQVDGAKTDFNDSVRFPSGSAIIYNGDPIYNYDMSYVCFEADGSFSGLWATGGYFFPYEAPFYPPDTVLKYLGKPYSGNYFFKNKRKIEIDNNLLKFEIGKIKFEIVKNNNNLLVLEQKQYLFVFAKDY